MKFRHEIVRKNGAEERGEVVTFKEFHYSFSPAAYRWFQRVAIMAGFSRRVKDTTIAGKHYTNDKGDVLELH